MKKRWSWVGALLLVAAFAACKKDVKDPYKGEVKPPQTSKTYETDAVENLVKDSIFYYTKLFSLWQDKLPPKNINDLDKKDYIRHNYTRYFPRGEDVLDWMVSIPKDAKGNPIDRFSFLDREGVVSGEIQDAIATSFGMYVIYLQTEDSGNNAHLYIRMVDNNSSANSAGIERGDRIMSINGNTAIDYNSQRAKDFKEIDNYLLKETNLTVKFKKPSGDEVTRTITSAQYDLDPVLNHQVIETNNKKVGYLAFSSFVSIKKWVNNIETHTPMYDRFESIFNGFESQGIDELVVDLRYNGGGSTLTAEYLVDRIVPPSANGKLMYRYEINALLKSFGWDKSGEEPGPFAPINISKKGTLDLQKVYFLVTKGSASASELLINALKPYMEVYMIGTYGSNDNGQAVAENTYGKPAGFFEWPIVNDDIGLYVTSFKMYNALGQGDYFDGLTPNAHVWEFAPGKFLAFGDRSESMLSTALNHISTGSFSPMMALRSGEEGWTNRPKAYVGIQENMRRNNMFKFNRGDVKLR